MKLGEKITALRKKKGLSQDALAHALNVSRQSISKWETGASTPELEKLIAICDLFQISLDELVRSNPSAGNTDRLPEQDTAQPVQTTPEYQQIIGYILLTIGILGIILDIILMQKIPMLGLILVIYGTICILVKQHAGLIIGWITMLPILFFHRSFTGIRLFSILNPSYYQNVAPGNYILAWIIWALLALLIWRTIYALRSARTNS